MIVIINEWNIQFSSLITLSVWVLLLLFSFSFFSHSFPLSKCCVEQTPNRRLVRCGSELTGCRQASGLTNVALRGLRRDSLLRFRFVSLPRSPSRLPPGKLLITVVDGYG